MGNEFSYHILDHDSFSILQVIRNDIEMPEGRKAGSESHSFVIRDALGGSIDSPVQLRLEGLFFINAFLIAFG
jgi:hypothetical protein